MATGTPPWALVAKLSEAKRRRRLCEEMFNLEKIFREKRSPTPTAWSTTPGLTSTAPRTAASPSPGSTPTGAALRRSATSRSGGCERLKILHLYADLQDVVIANSVIRVVPRCSTWNTACSMHDAAYEFPRKSLLGDS